LPIDGPRNAVASPEATTLSQGKRVSFGTSFAAVISNQGRLFLFTEAALMEAISASASRQSAHFVARDQRPLRIRPKSASDYSQSGFASCTLPQ
jgi:hypothetical protein